MAQNESVENARPIPFWVALLPVLALIGLLTVNVLWFDDSSTGPNQIALLLSASLAAILARCFGKRFDEMIEGISTGIQAAIPAILILLVIGALSGTWLISGIVPAMVYYGLQVLDPSYFLVASVVISAIVSVATGSSWSTIATVGVALIGIAGVIGVHVPLAAGAVISGAYFGDKVSPLSDTTNLAAAMAGTELFTHIRHMLWTTVPSLLITLGIFAVLGLDQSSDIGALDAAELSQVLNDKFNLTPVLFLVPVVVLVMVLMKIDTLVALLTGTVLAGVFAIIFQPGAVAEVARQVARQPSATAETVDTADTADSVGEPSAVDRQPQAGVSSVASAQVGEGSAPSTSLSLIDSYRGVIAAMGQSTQLKCELKGAEDLFSANGMSGMLNTVWLIICAMSFGGVMEASGLLRRLTMPLIEAVRSDGGLVTATAGSCLFFNISASDQYLAIVVPGRMFRETYRDRGLEAKNLSRVLEDSGTVTSVLVPWNTCGAAQAAALNIQVIAFAPFCFFNIISPIMTILFGWFGIAMPRRDDSNKRDQTEVLV